MLKKKINKKKKQKKYSITTSSTPTSPSSTQLIHHSLANRLVSAYKLKDEKLPDCHPKNISVNLIDWDELYGEYREMINASTKAFTQGATAGILYEMLPIELGLLTGSFLDYKEGKKLARVSKRVITMANEEKNAAIAKMKK